MEPITRELLEKQMRTLVFIVALLGITFVAAGGENPPSAAGKGTLVVIGHGFEHGGGQAVVNLLREQDNLFREPFRKAFAKIVAGKAELKFPYLSFGEYALILYHDENKNGEVDHNFIRLPSEPLGFSNGFAISLFSGKPTFAELRIRFDQNSAPFLIMVE